MSKILVTGMAGTGKSSVLAELGRRGYRVVDTDDPGWREYHAYREPADDLHRGEYRWVEEKMDALLASTYEPSLFVAGGVRNQATFYDRFDAVVLLSAPPEVLLERVAHRTSNDYGKLASERAEIAADFAEVQPLLRQHCTHELDVVRPLVEVVDELIAIAARPGARRIAAVGRSVGEPRSG